MTWMSDSSGTSIDMGQQSHAASDGSAARKATVTLIRRLASAGLCCYMLALWWEPKPTLFQWHPITMTAAFVASMPEGVYTALSMRRSRSLPERQALGRRHMLLSVVMSLLSLAGYAVIYVSKDRRNKKHLATWHGLLGAACVLATVAQSLLGSVVYFRWTSRGVIISKSRNAHKWLGLTVVALGCVSMFLGMRSNYAHGAIASAVFRLLLAIATTVLSMSAYVAE